MKLVFFDDYKLGVLKNGSVVDVGEVVKDIVHTSPQNLVNQLIGDFAKYRQPLENLANQSQGTPIDQVRLRAPLPEPTRIVAMAVNYMEHGTREKAAEIDAFHKSPSCVIGTGDTVMLPDCNPSIFEQEAELGLIIGKTASKVRPEDAYDYIFGYTNFIDVSARGFRPENRGSFFWGKTWDTFGPMGPCIVTADEIADPMNINIRSRINGDLYQDYPTSDMANDIPRIIEWVSWITTLKPGDIVAAGTNHQGLSGIQNGDRIELETDGLGKLTVHVRDDLGREWPRTTRHDKTPEQIQAIAGPAALDRIGG
jgi:2-keto-4-pentenoate hydratase/2-oxohepta-3-ene-1,7-dioic acid hydratase in catechol pathway